MANVGTNEPAVVTVEHVEQSQTKVKTKKAGNKRPRSSRHIELMEWLPTLPQLFAYMGVTQFLLMFWVFIGVCADGTGADWNLVLMWISVMITTIAFLVYNYLIVKHKDIPRTLTATLFGFIALLFIFYYPFTVSLGAPKKAGVAIYFLFKALVIGLVVAIYTLAYWEDIMCRKAHETTTVVNKVAK